MNEQQEVKPEHSRPKSRLSKWSRRGFIGAGVLAGGGLLIGIGVRPGNPIDRLSPLVAKGEGEQLVNSWVKIGTDNMVTAIVPHCEMGQGAHSVLAQMLADELDADWSTVSVMQAPADGNYVVTDTARMFVAPFTMNAADWIEPTWNGLFTQIAKLANAMITGGSSSIRTTGQHQMRIAGAAARQMLVGAAADAWGVPAGEITTRDSTLFHEASGKSAPYAEYATAAAEQDMPHTPRLKDVDQYRLMGKSKARTDIPSKVDGTAVFGMDAAIPDQNLSYAAVMRPPVTGTRVASMDAEQAKAMPGVLQILNMGDHIAVVADSYWQASQALGTIKATWTEAESAIKTTADQFAAFTKALDEAGADGGEQAAGKGDAAGAFAKATNTVEAEYKVPFLAHAPMEPINCTAWYRNTEDGDTCEIWTSTQVPLMARADAAASVGLDAEDMTIHHPMLGGAFGRRLTSEYVAMAARVAKATGYPVKMIWSREEDTQKSMYRPAELIRMKAGLDKDGKLLAYDSIFTQRNDPAEAAIPAGYAIPNVSVRVAEAPLHLPFAAWRSVDHSQHGFFTESLIDEAAHEAGADPLDYRIAMLGDAPRHKAVLEKLREVSGWDTPAGEGKGRGVAMVESFGSIVAEAIEVDMSSGKPRATKVWAVADPGYAMNPDGFRNQIEGGIVFALTAAFHGELDLVDGAVKQSNFHDYKMLRMNECPDIEVAIINSGPVPIGGAGEPGVPPAAPALTNAIFAATGKRIRELPINKQFA